MLNVRNQTQLNHYSLQARLLHCCYDTFMILIFELEEQPERLILCCVEENQTGLDQHEGE